MEIGIREIFEISYNIVFIVLVCWVAISILRRYRVTKYLPALLVGSGFFIWGFIFAPLLGLERLIMQRWPEIAGLVGPGAPIWFRFLNIVTANVFVIGLFLFAVFTRQVFRPGSTASLFFLVFIGILLIGSSDLLLVFDEKACGLVWGARLEIKIVYVIGNTLNWGWLAYESLSRWWIYRRQLREGKELDLLVVNRFLLWGLVGVSQVVSTLGNLLIIPYEAIAPLFPALVKEICIFLLAILSYLSWSPPEWFKQIIRKRKPTRA